MRRLFAIFILILWVTTSCYDSHNDGSKQESSTLVNCTIAQLQHLGQSGCYTVTEDLICKGYVTSSDSEGNFYRSMVIEDGSGAIEVKLGIYNIASQYPVGLMVDLRIKGLALMVEDGVLHVGLPPHSFDSTPREMEALEVIDSHIIRGTSVVDIEPLVCDVASLNLSLCGRFVRVENLIYSPLEGFEESNFYRFIDNRGNAIFIEISQYADFIDIEIPTTELSAQGILYYGSVGRELGKQLIVKPRFKDDLSTPNIAL